MSLQCESFVKPQLETSNRDISRYDWITQLEKTFSTMEAEGMMSWFYGIHFDWSFSEQLLEIFSIILNTSTCLYQPFNFTKNENQHKIRPSIRMSEMNIVNRRSNNTVSKKSNFKTLKGGTIFTLVVEPSSITIGNQ